MSVACPEPFAKGDFSFPSTSQSDIPRAQSAASRLPMSLCNDRRALEVLAAERARLHIRSINDCRSFGTKGFPEDNDHPRKATRMVRFDQYARITSSRS